MADDMDENNLNENEEEEDPNENIFMLAEARASLRSEMSRRSPRRASAGSSFATTTLPFYEDISPSEALGRLFDWFHSTGEGSTITTPSNSVQEAISHEEFSNLCACIGKGTNAKQDWNRALEELGSSSAIKRVARSDFRSLFGPPPFFGSGSVQDIVHEVMKAEEYIHFAQILVDRFGVMRSDATSTRATTLRGPEKVVGLAELQDIQRACCADVVLEAKDWDSLCTKIDSYTTIEGFTESDTILIHGHGPWQYLDWRQFASLFGIRMKGKRLFSPHKDPAEVVYADLANHNILATIKDENEENVSRKTFTNLLRATDTKDVDDTAWMDLLQQTTTYSNRKEKRPRKGSSADIDVGQEGHSCERPMVVVRNTRNQVLSYEIMFTEQGDVGLELQSDFYGQCPTVADVHGEASLHPIIQKHDIVAAVNGSSLLYDTPATSKDDEQERVERAKALLESENTRRITFHRQDSYYQFVPEDKTLRLFVKTFQQISSRGTIVIRVPEGLPWKPASSSVEDLQVNFAFPQHSDFDFATIVWNKSSKWLEITLNGEVGIAENLTLELQIVGMDCGSDAIFGPCDLTETKISPAGFGGKSTMATSVALFTNWKFRENWMQTKAFRERQRRPDDYLDESLKPIGKEFQKGASGITLGSDFFGQCAVVTNVKASSLAAKLDVHQNDILSSISSLGENKGALNQLNCIKPFTVGKAEANRHLAEVKKHLEDCHKSKRPYYLQFLRLNSYYSHEDGRTILAFNSLTTLREGSSLVFKMPSTSWYTDETLTAKILEPVGAEIREEFWDSQQQSVRLVLDACSIAESTPITIEIGGLKLREGKEGAGVKYAGPSEIVGLDPGNSGYPPEIEFELHENWHSFMVGHQGIDVTNIADALRQFKTSPAKLWEKLEYTSLLFDMWKPSDAKTMKLADLNNFIGIVCGDESKMDESRWKALCVGLGANVAVGLSRRQFACCWSDIDGLNTRSEKEVYTLLDTADKLFMKIISIFQAEKNPKDMILLKTLQSLEKASVLARGSAKRAQDILMAQELPGWDRDYFFQIVCDKNPDVKLEDKAFDVWVKLYYSNKLFDEFSRKGRHAGDEPVMERKGLAELLAAAKISAVNLTTDRWTDLCDYVAVDDTVGLTFAEFLKAYSAKAVGPDGKSILGDRHALADYYRIETFKLLPERRIQETETSKEATMVVAPQKVNVKDVATKALEETVTTEELFNDLREQGLEFSKLEKISEQVVTTFKFEGDFAAKKPSRAKGFLHMKVKSVTELADRLLLKDASFNKDGQPEELYVMFQVSDDPGPRPETDNKSASVCASGWSFLWGNTEKEVEPCIEAGELWKKDTQDIIKTIQQLEDQLALQPAQTPEYQQTLAELKMYEGKLKQEPAASKDGRIFSSAILRDPSPDALFTFPEDEFRLYVNHNSQKPQFVVCKIFKRIGSEIRQLELEWAAATKAFEKAQSTQSILSDLVRQQEKLLKLTIIEAQANGDGTLKDPKIRAELSKLKQKRADLREFKSEVDRREANLQNIAKNLKDFKNAGHNESGRLDKVAPQPTLELTGTRKTTRRGSSKIQEPGKSQQDIDCQNARLIGHVFFELGELLQVLHEDTSEMEDLVHFQNDKDEDVGVLLVHFQYKCASEQLDAAHLPLPKLTISMGDDVDADTGEAPTYEYPSQSHLELKWDSDTLQSGDRLSVVKEGEDFKFSMPYFNILWHEKGWSPEPQPDGGEAAVPTPESVPVDNQAAIGENEVVLESNEAVANNNEAVDVNPDREQAYCDWWIPDMAKKMYDDPAAQLVATASSRTSGKLQFPSSIGLSLPPGAYRIYLIRNQKKGEDGTGSNCRLILGKTPLLAVLPGVNSAYTSFGTTSLIDVKPLNASLQVYAKDFPPSSSEFTDDWKDDYKRTRYQKIDLAQEREITRQELKKLKEIAQNSEDPLTKEKIEALTNRVKELDARKAQIDEVEVTPEAETKPTQGKASDDLILKRSDSMVFSYRFHGGVPCSRDRIVILPADVVKVSDNLCAAILGRLQTNDPREVEVIRTKLESQLLEVEELFDYSSKNWLKTIGRLLKRMFFRSAAKSSEDSFVLDECLSAYNKAPHPVRKNFALIIQDLLEEIRSRKAQLGLQGRSWTMSADGKQSARRTGKRFGVEIPVLSQSGSQCSFDKSGDIIGQREEPLGVRFAAGGLYVAKYVRRPDRLDESSLLNEAVGELCRYGPFTVEAAAFSWSPQQLSKYAGKLVMKAIMSDQGKLILKIVGQTALSVAKYFLGVVSLSFNLRVLGDTFSLKGPDLDKLTEEFHDQLAHLSEPMMHALRGCSSFFGNLIDQLTGKLKVFDMANECYSGLFLVAGLFMMICATFIAYVVVQEDLLLKVQKIYAYLPFTPGKSLHSALDQFGALLVIPLYLMIKSCVLFLSSNWLLFYGKLRGGNKMSGLETFKLYNTATAECPNLGIVQANFWVGIVALVLITLFLFICLPLLLLDLYSWVPLTELEEEKELRRLAHSRNSRDIEAAIHSNAPLVEPKSSWCPRHGVNGNPRSGLRMNGNGEELFQANESVHARLSRKKKASGSAKDTGCKTCPKSNKSPTRFQRFYTEYTTTPFRELLKARGLLKLLGLFVYVFTVLMFKSMGRAFGAVFGWRHRGSYMYPNKVLMAESRCPDRASIRFNLVWKLQYIKKKIVLSFCNLCLVTFGLWGETQWAEYNVEERANDCYQMEPSGESKQLQMMTLHGKIVSLFWLCVPKTTMLAYLSEVLNRGPVFSYFLNKNFLQADTPESEREKDPVWRFHARLGLAGEENVLYLADMRFIGTAIKWGSAIVEIVSLTASYSSHNKQMLFLMALISTAVAPILELNQQIITAYVDYVEALEHLAGSRAMEIGQTIQDIGAPPLQVNLAAATTKKDKKGAKDGASDTEALNLAVATGTNATAKSSPNSAHAVGEQAAAGITTPEATPIGPSASPSVASSASALTAVRDNAMTKTLIENAGSTIELGGDDEMDPDEMLDELGEEVDNQLEEVDEDDTLAAAAVAAVQMVKPKKELILLKAMPQLSYVVLTDALDMGEGEITISWQVNAKQRFHALDAIGMFPARAPGDTSIREMDKCICYRLLKDKGQLKFGWKPKGLDNESEEHELMNDVTLRQARFVSDGSRKKLLAIEQARHDLNDEDEKEAIDRQKKEEMAAESKMEAMVNSSKLKPYKKKFNEIIHEEYADSKDQKTDNNVLENGGETPQELAKRARKTVEGQVLFRPANNCVKMTDHKYEAFVYGNNAGIYQPKYGLHGYEFCYLRYNDGEAKMTGLVTDKMKSSGGNNNNNKVIPDGEDQSKNYVILDRFCSNDVQIGTFNIFMTLTCDMPLVGANETLNLGWIIYGVDYAILSNAKCRNCVAFYRVDCKKTVRSNQTSEEGGSSSDASACVKIESIPTSAYLEVKEGEPVPGRMIVTTPQDPGVYEIRFLFNFFKDAQLHRQCQIFGDLEDQMQEIRISSLFEKRAVTEAICKFPRKKPDAWRIARLNTFIWLKSMLLTTVREPVKPSMKESTTEYGEFLFNRLKGKLRRALCSRSKRYQSCLRKMLVPLRGNAFISLLRVAMENNSLMEEQLASVAFFNPTDDDVNNLGINKFRDSLLMPTNKKLFMYGRKGIRGHARQYLNQASLCGYQDFVDDIALNNKQLLGTVNQVMDDFSGSCVVLYESALVHAIEEMMKEAESLGVANVLQGVDVKLLDLCRNHVQDIIRAFVETDCRTGLRWKGPPKGSREQLNVLKEGGNELRTYKVTQFEVDSSTPVTLKHLAVRRWIRPKLERKIMTVLRQRYAHMMNSNFQIAFQLVASLMYPGLALSWNPAHSTTGQAASPLYFLGEEEENAAKGDSSAQNSGEQGEAEDEKGEEDKEEEEAEKEEEVESEGEGDDDEEAEGAGEESEEAVDE